MTDLATLGFAVNSEPLARATTALKGMVPAAREAGAAVDGMVATVNKAKPAADSLSSSARTVGQGLVAQSATVTRLSNEYKQLATMQRQADVVNAANSRSFQGLSNDAKNLSYQLVDVTQGLLTGQPIFMIFAQQIGQIGQVAATSEKGIKGLFAEIGSGIARILTPTRLATAGIVAIGAAALAAASSWKAYALAVDDARRVSGMSSTAMAGLTSAAGFKGISSDDFLSQFRDFAGTVAQARNGVGDLAVQFRAMGQPIGASRETFERLADAVKNAANDQQRIQILAAAGLPTSRQWVDLMSQGADGIREAVRQANAFGGAANDNMVRKAKEFDDAWNSGITNLRTGWNKLFLDVFGWFEQLSSKGTAALLKIASYLPRSLRPDIAGNILRASMQDNVGSRLTQSAADDFYGSVSNLFKGQNAAGTTPDPAKIMADNQRAQQRIAILGDLATVDDQVKQKELELSAAWLSSGVNAGKYRDAILNAVRAQAEMSRVQQQASIGIFDFNTANKAAADTMQMWIDKKLLDPTNIEQMNAAWNNQAKYLRDLADAASVAGSKLPQLQQALNDVANVNKQLDQFASTSMTPITAGLADIIL